MLCVPDGTISYVQEQSKKAISKKVSFAMDM